MFSSDFIFRQQENLVDNQKCQAGFRPVQQNTISYRHIHNASQEYFWSKNFQISCTGSKVPFGQFFNFSSCDLKSYTGSVSS